MKPKDPAYPGHAHYTSWFLRISELLVLAIYGPLVGGAPLAAWCSATRGTWAANTLDAGPGSGYFLEAAERLRSANIALLSSPSAKFGEYFEPYTSEPLGSLQQSWTAAVALDWSVATA